MGHASIALTALLLCGRVALAQTTGTLQGRVVDEKGAPISGAAIRIEGTPRGARSRVDGSFRILAIRAGEYRVKVTAVGYHAVTREKVGITVGNTTTAGFTLTVVTEAERGPVRLPEERSSAVSSELSGRRRSIEEIVRRDSSMLLRQPVMQWRNERSTETSIRIDGIDTAAIDSTAPRREP